MACGEGGAKGVCVFIPLPTPNPTNHVSITNSTRYGKLILFWVNAKIICLSCHQILTWRLKSCNIFTKACKSDGISKPGGIRYNKWEQENRELETTTH